MIKIVPFNYRGKNAIAPMMAPMDSCGNRSIALIQCEASMIPVCRECLNRINNDLKIINGSSTH